MLIVRDQQWKSLELDRLAQLKRRVLQHIAHAYPDDCAEMGEAGASRLIDHAIQFGASRGIRNGVGITGLVGLLIEFGLDFHLAPYRAWVVSILDHPKLAGHLKVGMIRERLNPITRGRRIVRYQES